MADLYPSILFNDGEGLDEDDLNELQHRLTAMFRDMQQQIRMGGAVDIGHAVARGGDLFNGNSFASVRAYLPYLWQMNPATLEIDGSNQLDVSLGNFALVTRRDGSTPGSQPTGASNTMARHVDDDEIQHLNSARPAANNRYDSIGVQLGYGVGNSLTRDFEDAATRELSTQSQNKNEIISLASELVQGAEAASPVLPALTAGFARLLSVLRTPADAAPLDPDNVILHGYPTRVAVEDIPGHLLAYVGVTGTDWDRDTTWGTSLEKKTDGTGIAYAFPRTMHAGCRLVGIGLVGDNLGDDIAIDVGRFTYSGSTGQPAFTALENLGNGGPVGASDSGFLLAGDADFSLPVWGNGHRRGPLLSTHRQNYGSAGSSALDKLVVRLQHTGTITVGGRIQLVRFVYLY